MRTKSIARAMLDKKGVAFAKLYLDPPGDEGGYPCENGHAGCAHNLKGACRVELKELIENFSKPAAAPDPLLAEFSAMLKKKGPAFCAELLKGFDAEHERCVANERCAGELMAYGVSPEEAMACG